MFRGYARFKCDKCGATFKAPDIEYMAAMWSTPQPCPACGSLHTWPCGLLGSIFGWSPTKYPYTTIWKTLDQLQAKQDTSRPDNNC